MTRPTSEQMPYTNFGVPNELQKECTAKGIGLQKWLEQNWTEVRTKPEDYQTASPKWLMRSMWCKKHVGDETYDYYAIGMSIWYFRDPNMAILFKLTCA